MQLEQKSSLHCSKCRNFLQKFSQDMQAWNCRELDSPLPSDITLHNLEPARPDSGMSFSTDFDDDFFNLDLHQQERSASFGGVTQYSQQFLREKCSFSPYFHTSLETVDSGRTSLYGSNEQCGQLGGASSNGSTAMLHTPDGSNSHQTSFPSDFRMSESPDDTVSGKKTTTRRNAWGNMSYAELITTAIMASPEKRLTLAQVYEWMVQNVPYFRDKGDSNSSAGWKNSIRHNLSLHSRFMRIQNEGAGKSSWWVINPDAKPGRNPRRTRERSNTIETTTKAQLEKSRRGAKKRIKERALMGSLHSTLNGNSIAGSIQTISHDLYDDDSMQGAFDNVPSSFRPRTQSNLSIPGSSSRVSPAIGSDIYDDLEFPSWVGESVPAIPSDIVDRTDQMRIDATTHIGGVQIKQESKPIKTEPIAPPPSYHELNSVRGSCAQNPLLRNPIVPSTNFKPMPLPGAYGNYQNGGITPINWLSTSNSSPLPGIQSCGIVAAQHTVASSSALPIDLENLTLPDQPLMDTMDVDALIRHELSQAGGQHIHFDL
ncbi:Forkhead box protein O [Caenorhabditis elegans]|uniref:Forkhead box protein O n=8 Tax=Caenorhabditis elegans TaxID=6239 RepID=FOXO_CAEEL|nr:Forkhead box protein O [Caenorhabditis elegans]O16850.3 RecName: Full=Forkhead box protein O; Short=FOXO; AltName: Full=Abnormal dauer formation protein 16 [Caenorhabditis elegans]CCD71857.1 Forkhead box protein O [Caenorhabditis elegans]|eukprot:NP_001251490.1 Forkhead box protein O [Caenorhabditis elegans]